MAKGISDRDLGMEAFMKPGSLPMEQVKPPADAASPLDTAIERVASYIEDPSMVTPETLQELLDMLMQVKGPDNALQEPGPA